MGKRGPKPLSDAEKRRRGTFQPCRSAAARAARTQPKAKTTPPPRTPRAAPPATRTPGAAPQPPRHLSAAARAAWRETVRQLGDTAAAADVRVLELYATALAALRKAAAQDPCGRAALRWMALVDKLRRDLPGPAVPPQPDPAAAPETPAAPEATAPPLDVTREFLFGGLKLLPGARPPPPLVPAVAAVPGGAATAPEPSPPHQAHDDGA